MATPPFNTDITDPADNAIVSQFPANERTFRDNIGSFVEVEHDVSTGHHALPIVSTTSKNAIATPPNGMVVFDSTLGVFQINTGTSISPVWTTIGPSAQTGDIKMWAATVAPTGWLNCDGSAVSRTTYAALFSLVGTTFGAGDGSTTFNVPDFRGRAPFGYDSGNASARLTAAETGGVSAATIGNAGGEQGHTLGTTEIPAHNHGVTDPGHAHNLNYLSSFDVSGGAGAAVYTNLAGSPTGSAVQSATTGITTQNAGGGAAHNNVPPALVVNFVIKT